MNSRVTSQVQVNQSIADMQRHTASIARLQDQVTSGVRLQRPSESPSDYVALLDNKARVQRLETHLNTINESTFNLNSGVSSLTDANNILTQVHDLVGEGLAGGNDATNRESLANVLDGLIGNLISVANTKVNGRNLFGGTNTTGTPFAVTSTDTQGRPLAVAYQGSTERARTVVGNDQTIDDRYTGEEVFQGAGGDLFATLISIRDDLRNTTLDESSRAQSLTQKMKSVETSRDHLIGMIGNQASKLERLDAMKTRIEDLKVDTNIRTGDLENTDYAETAIRYQEQTTAFQATLAISARIFNNSILDFIR